MNINRISVFAVCFAVGLAIVSEPSMAKWKKKKSVTSFQPILNLQKEEIVLQ